MSDDPKKPSTSAPLGQEASGEWREPGKSLTLEGRVTGERPVKAEPPAPAPAAPSTAPGELPSLAALNTSELELVRDPTARGDGAWQEPLPYRDAPPIRSRRMPLSIIALLVLLAGGGLAALWKFPRLARNLPVAATDRGALVISSEPSGADLFINGTSMGRTPWAADNTWGGEVKWEIRLKGYRTARGTFKGGEAQHLEPTLEPE